MNPNPFSFYPPVTFIFLNRCVHFVKLNWSVHNTQQFLISCFKNKKRICFSLEISLELRELKRFSFGATKRACVGRGGFSPVPFLSFFQSTYFSLAKISLLFTAGIRSGTSSPLFWKHLLLMMQLLLQ